MIIEGNVLTAEEGKAIRRKGETEPSTIQRISLAANDSPDNWEDCHYGESMKYSTLSIKRELARLGKWESAKSLLEANGYWDDYVLANYLVETDSVFTIACAAMIANGIVTEEELKELLPKCVWTAE